MLSRNEAMGIVQRSNKNLAHMRNARRIGEDVHEVTHLFNSLLGLIVIPWERESEIAVDLDTRIEDLWDQGWPTFDVSIDEYPDKTVSLKVLVYHLRNAVAHGRFRFEGIGSASADSRDPSEIRMIVSDQTIPPRGKPVLQWKAEITGDALNQFCDKFIQYIEDRVG